MELATTVGLEDCRQRQEVMGGGGERISVLLWTQKGRRQLAITPSSQIFQVFNLNI